MIFFLISRFSCKFVIEYGTIVNVSFCAILKYVLLYLEETNDLCYFQDECKFYIEWPMVNSTQSMSFINLAYTIQYR